MHRLGLSCQRLGASEAGSSAIEYSLLVALLAALALFVWDSGRPAMQGTFARLALNGSGTAADAEASNDLRSDIGQAPSPSALTRSQSLLAPWRMPLTVVAIVISAIGLVVCRGRNPAEEKREELADTPSSLERILDKRQRMLRFLSSNTEMVFESRLSVAHLMTPRLETVPATMPIEELRRMTIDKGIHHLLVTDSTGLLVGVISDRDILSRAGKTAGEVMTANPCSVAPDSPLCGALTVLLQKRISCLPVASEGRPCGILTTTDVILALQCFIQTMEKAGAVA